MQSKRREDFIEGFTKSPLQKFWNGFMSVWYVCYVLISFFSVLFGMCFILYFSYYRYNLHNLILGIVITSFMLILNSRRPI